MLRYKSMFGEDASFIATQADCFKKAEDKLPTFFKNDCYYTAKSLEQCTSEAVAAYKQTIIKGKTLLEICGGLGVDSWALSKNFEQIISVDTDEELNAIVINNYQKLGIKNIQRLSTPAESYISSPKTLNKFTAVYADPDRRPSSKRTGSLKDSLPDITAMLPDLLSLAETVFIKASPMYDISMGFRELGTVRKVYVLGYKNEVKELLFEVGQEQTAEPEIHTVNIYGDGHCDEMVFGKRKEGPPIKDEGDYFFEPDSCIIKSGRYGQYAVSFGLNSVDRNIPFFTGNTLPEHF
ncbi:MAG: RsmD family RNA methyltransferase, partial [Bacteroidia bacterium]|nr:RsmD family RNA methyltransferase [Bacteroidia bacterium]